MHDTVAVEDRPLDGYALYAAGVLTVIYVMNFLDRQLLAVLAEAVKADLSITDAQLGFLFGTAFSVFFAVFGLPFGRFADLGNRTKLIAASAGFWSVMTSASAFAGGYGHLAACRFGVGFGEAGASPAAYSLLYDYFPQRLRTTALSIYNMGVYIGSGIGLFLGGAILTAWATHYPGGVGAPFGLKGWQAAFLVVGLPGLILALWVLTLREPQRLRDDGSVVPPHPSPVRETVMVFAALLPILNIPLLLRAGGAGAMLRNMAGAAVILIVAYLLVWLTGDIAQWAALGVGAYAVFSWGQGLSLRDPGALRSIFGNGPLVLLLAGIGAIMFMSYSFTFWTVPYYQRAFAASAQQTGYVLGLATGIGGTLGVLAGGFLADAARRRHPAGKSWVFLLSITCSTLSALMLLTAPNETTALYANFIFVFAVASGISPALSAISDQAPVQLRGTAMALTLLTTNTTGFAIGPYVIGKMSDQLTAAGNDPATALRGAMLASAIAAPIAILLVIRAAVLIGRRDAAHKGS